MTTGLWIIIAVAGLLIGLAIGFLAALEKTRLECNDTLEKTRREAGEALERSRREGEEAVEKAKAEVREEQERHYTRMMEQLKENFHESLATMKEEVRNSTKSMLEERQREFASTSKESLSQIIEPLQQNIRQMREAVQDNTLKNTSYSGQLKEGIAQVLQQSQATMASADRLANALSVGNKTQGNWGERILSELLESSGLKEGIHFETQAFIRDEKGDRIVGDQGTGLQPDVILHIEKGHDVVIDSKVSLTAFMNYMDAQTDEERARYLKEHVQSVKSQVNKLVKANYAAYLKGALDYVIMFVPISQALYLATQEDHHLWREAMEKKVYIADEQTLYAALKVISMNWRQQAQAENHEAVYKLANEMLVRVGQFMDRFTSVGKALETAGKAFEDAKKKLAENGQSIPQTCRKLVTLGAKYDKKKDTLSHYLENTAEDAEA